MNKWRLVSNGCRALLVMLVVFCLVVGGIATDGSGGIASVLAQFIAALWFERGPMPAGAAGVFVASSIAGFGLVLFLLTGIVLAMLEIPNGNRNR